jgi:hypothetical protein
MPEFDLDAIERRANNQRATDEDLIDLATEVRRLQRSEAISWRIGLDLARKLTEALGLDPNDPDACVPGCDEPGGLEHDLWHLVQQRDQLAKQLEASKAAHAADYAHLDEQVGQLRAAVDAALTLHRSRKLNFTRVPPGSSLEEARRIYESTPKRLICDADHENYPCATVRALAPNKQEQRQEAT